MDWSAAGAAAKTYENQPSSSHPVHGDLARQLPPRCRTITPDLQKLANGRNAQWIAAAKGKSALQVKDLLWLDDVTFANGTIEIDILGRSAPPQSNFISVAFRGLDEKTYDCVYFRPFNFRAAEAGRASHAVQYTSEPQWPWTKLRQEKTGQYEKAITPETQKLR